jgi:hypothetical protein
MNVIYFTILNYWIVDGGFSFYSDWWPSSYWFMFYWIMYLVLAYFTIILFSLAYFCFKLICFGMDYLFYLILPLFKFMILFYSIGIFLFIPLYYYSSFVRFIHIFTLALDADSLILMTIGTIYEIFYSYYYSYLLVNSVPFLLLKVIDFKSSSFNFLNEVRSFAYSLLFIVENRNFFLFFHS